MNKRVDYLDVAKGITILLVIIGHTFATYDPDSFIGPIIGSFHMPLFFILSGYFFKSRDFGTAFRNGVKHLLLPYALVHLVRITLAILNYGWTQKTIKNFIYPVFYGSGSTNELRLWNVNKVGMTWFFMGLFCCQLLYLCLNEISKNYRISLWILVIAVAIFGVELNKEVWLPFSLQPAMGGLIFYHAGRRMNELGILSDDIRNVNRGGYCPWTWPLGFGHLLQRRSNVYQCV